MTSENAFESVDKGMVFVGRAHGDAQAAAAMGHAVAVSDEYALRDEVVVDLVGIVEPHEQEIGVAIQNNISFCITLYIIGFKYINNCTTFFLKKT